MAKTEVEELIEAAQATMKKWSKPSNEQHVSNRSMQELLDGKPCPTLRVRKL